MNDQQIENIRKNIIGVLKAHKVQKAALFGSVVIDKITKNSDIDLLVEFSGKKGLLDLVGLKLELQKSLKRDVDLLTYNSLHPLLKKKY